MFYGHIFWAALLLDSFLIIKMSGIANPKGLFPQSQKQCSLPPFPSLQNYNEFIMDLLIYLHLWICWILVSHLLRSPVTVNSAKSETNELIHLSRKQTHKYKWTFQPVSLKSGWIFSCLIQPLSTCLWSVPATQYPLLYGLLSSSKCASLLQTKPCLNILPAHWCSMQPSLDCKMRFLSTLSKWFYEKI